MGDRRSARNIRNFSVELWQDLVGLTWHQKVHFPTFDGKLELQCTRNGPQNPPFCPGSLSRTPLLFITRYLTNINAKLISQKEQISRIANLKIQKPRFTNRSPEKHTACSSPQATRIYPALGNPPSPPPGNPSLGSC